MWSFRLDQIPLLPSWLVWQESEMNIRAKMFFLDVSLRKLWWERPLSIFCKWDGLVVSLHPCIIVLDWVKKNSFLETGDSAGLIESIWKYNLCSRWPIYAPYYELYESINIWGNTYLDPSYYFNIYILWMLSFMENSKVLNLIS